MQRIDQNIAEQITIVSRSEIVYIEQHEDEGYKDVIQLEKQSIPDLIAALQKHIE